MAQTQKKTIDPRRYRPNEPLQPTKGKKKATRPFARGSNLTDLLGTDIFGGQMASEHAEPAPLRPSNTIREQQPMLKKQNSNVSPFGKWEDTNPNPASHPKYAKQPPLDQTKYKQSRQPTSLNPNMGRSNRNIPQNSHTSSEHTRPTSSQTNQGPRTQPMPVHPGYSVQNQRHGINKSQAGPPRGFPGR